ncbi:metabotropic glycine receptor [Trichomycterus rosablanca]|uniref:metabotropic glycine receptor n=1 Tax=Trichomycterus rosablanca TaxID=2290929 RepID=UPI002F35D609
MDVLLLYLLLQTGFAHASNEGYVEWSDGADEDGRIGTKQHRVRGTERMAAGAEELPRVVAAFLHTGDPSRLSQVNCSRRYELSSLGSAPPVPRVTSFPPVAATLNVLAHATHFLNSLTWESKQDPRKKQHQLCYRALLRSMLEQEPKIQRVALAVHAEQLHLQARRSGELVSLRELSAEESEWYLEFRKRTRMITQSRMVPKSPVQWSAPYLECERGRFVPHWLLTLSVGVYGLNSDAEPEIRGAVRVDVNLQDLDIDQCASTGWFAGTHRCNLTTTECKAIPGHGFVLDKYQCQCKRGFYQHSRVTLNGFSNSERDNTLGPEPSEVPGLCLPCQEGCMFCLDNMPCLAQEDDVLRLAVVSFQGLCVLLDVISMAAVYRFRRDKRIKASGFILLEVILSGAVLLYLPVMILHFDPGVLWCVLLRWVRLLGFATVYGTVILKLYRVLKVFLSRTAQRIPYMTSWHVLRLLGAILLVVLWFLVAWTSAMFQRRETHDHHAMIDVGVTPEGLQFSMCLLDRWDYMMAVAEFLFLLWGVYLCYCVRTVPSTFHEPRYMAIAIYNELLISAIFHIIRFTLAPGLHPDWMLMLFFVHTHLTVTVTLGLLLMPKFLFTGTHMQDDIATEAYEDELDMRRSGSYLNSSITSAWSEHSLDPEDIRDELKKLYSQLEIYKRKKMLANNPHLQKKRNSKKGIRRTLMRRITEIPETVSRQYSREDRDGSEHGSNRSTLRRNPSEPSHGGKAREESLKSKVFSLKRSHSYDHTPDQGEHANGVPPDKIENSSTELSLLGTLIGRRSAKKNSDLPKVDPAESAESVPLVCKSISAHNLAAYKKPIHLRSSMIQKSLSVIASARERTLGLAGKTHSVEDTSKKGLKNKEVHESPECFPKMIISQSVEYTKTPSKMGIMKQQVSGSQPSICSEPGRSKDLYDLSEVCPWEMEDLPTLSEGKTQKHVSIAPSNTNTIYESGTKSGRSQQKPRIGVSSPSNRRRSKDKGGTREEGSDRHEGRKPNSPLKSEVCPWEFDNQSLRGVESAGLSPDKPSRKKSMTPTDEKPKIVLSDISKSTGSLLHPPASMVDVCPWNYDQPPSSPTSTHHSKRRDSNSKRKGSCSSRGKNKDDDKHGSKSKERRSSSSKPSEKHCQAATVGSGRRRSSTKEAEVTDGEGADVGPWEVKRSPKGRRPSSEDHHETSSLTSSALAKVNTRAWDCDDESLGNSA